MIYVRWINKFQVVVILLIQNLIIYLNSNCKNEITDITDM